MDDSARVQNLDARADSLSGHILRLSDLKLTPEQFLERVAGVVSAHAGSVRADVCLRDNGSYVCAGTGSETGDPLRGEVLLRCDRCESDKALSCARRPIEGLCAAILKRELAPVDGKKSRGGSLHLSGPLAQVELQRSGIGDRLDVEVELGSNMRSAVLIPFAPEPQLNGLLVLRSSRPRQLTPLGFSFYESVAQLVGVALAHRASRQTLRERVMELTQLHHIAELLASPEASAGELAHQAVRLVALGCPASGPVRARVVIDGEERWWPDRASSGMSYFCEVAVRGRARGLVEVADSDESVKPPRNLEARRFLQSVATTLAAVLSSSDLREQQEKLEAQVLHAERLATIGTLTAGLIHEVNQPIGAILGYAELVKKDAGLSDASRRDLDRVIAASRHLRGMVHKLLDYARASVVSQGLTELNRAVEDALDFVEPCCLSRGVQVIRRLDPHLPDLYANPQELCQLVVNLSTNAVRAMPNGGVLTVETGTDGKHLQIAVQDTGVGMPPDVQAKMFEAFFTANAHDGGLGLGLSLVQGIVRSYDGTLSVKSAVGEGTRITISLPVEPSRPGADSQDSNVGH